MCILCEGTDFIDFKPSQALQELLTHYIWMLTAYDTEYSKALRYRAVNYRKLLIEALKQETKGWCEKKLNGWLTYQILHERK